MSNEQMRWLLKVIQPARTLASLPGGAGLSQEIHAALLEAYFVNSRDISQPATLAALWREVDLPYDALARASEPELLRRVLAEHDEATDLGVGGVPAVRMAGSDVAITGAQPTESYRRWIQKQL